MITIGRRQFLHNAGRLMLLPVFQGLWNDPVYASSKTASWVHLYFPMGCYKREWTLPQGAFNVPSYLSPFNDIKSKMLWFNDVENKIARDGTGAHEQIGGCSISCAAQLKDPERCYNISADQLMAREWKDRYPNGTLTLSKEGSAITSGEFKPFEPGLNNISWVAPGKPASKISDPKLAISQFFGNGQKVENLTEVLADGKSSLDYFTKQVQAVKTKIGSEDQQRLEQYTEAMRDYEKKVANNLSYQAECKVDMSLANSPSFLDHQNTMLKLIVLALQCNITPSITYMMDFEFSFQSYKEIGVNERFHDVTHHSDGEAAKIENHKKINTHYASQFSKLVKEVGKLKNAAGQPLLNDVLISMNSGMSNSNTHDRDGGLPMVLAGGSSLGVPQGKLYAPQASMSEVMRTIMTYAGLSEATVNAYGQGQGHLVGRLQKLL